MSEFILHGAVEAKVLLLLVTDSTKVKRVELQKWLLRRLYRPLRPLIHDNVRILHVSATRLSSLMQTQTVQQKTTNIYTLDNLPNPDSFYDRVYKLMPTTVDCYTGEVIISEVFESLKKSIYGLVQPSILKDLDRDEALQFEPEISITVIAESSHFASNANVFLYLEEFPTMKVLLQNVTVTKTNVSKILVKLQCELNDYQQRVAELREKVKRVKQFRVPYRMDTENEEETEFSDVKNIWRLGSGGGNLAYSLNAGLFAARLCPNDGFASLVIITDGVVKSTLVQMSDDDDIIQELCREDISCNIIQVGSGQGFNPTCSFGLVPDNELLRFVAAATGGTFSYACDCPNDISSESLKDGIASNFYHSFCLLRETSFSKKKIEYRYASLSDKPERSIDAPRERRVYGNHNVLDVNDYNFPWDPRSLSPPVETILTRYREYTLHINVQQLISFRIRQGFMVESVEIVRNMIHISLLRLWLPNIMIQYKIKALWSGENRGMIRLRVPRIEINVIADIRFSMYFIRVQTGVDNDPRHPSFSKVIRLDKFLATIYETDELLNEQLFYRAQKDIMQRNRGFAIDRVEKIKQFWCVLEQSPFRLDGKCWYDQIAFQLIASPSRKIFSKSSLIAAPIHAALSRLRLLLGLWASFEISKDEYIKLFSPHEGDKACPFSFCKLNLKPVYGSLILFTLSFFNVNMNTRQREADKVRNMIADTLSFFNVVTDNKDDHELWADKVGKKINDAFSFFNADVNAHQEEADKFRKIIDDDSYGREDETYYICRRPLSFIMIPDMDDTMPDDQNSAVEIIPAGYRSIVQSYLQCRQWSWLDDVEDDVSRISIRTVPLQDLALQYLFKARLDEKYMLVYHQGSLQIFYREIDFGAESKEDEIRTSTVCGVQYIVVTDTQKGRIHTKLLMEPSEDKYLKDRFEPIADAIEASDRRVMSHLVTFDQLYQVGASHRKQDVTDRTQSRLSNLFNLSLLLRSSPILVANYYIPCSKSTSLSPSPRMEVLPRSNEATPKLSLAGFKQTPQLNLKSRGKDTPNFPGNRDDAPNPRTRRRTPSAENEQIADLISEAISSGSIQDADSNLLLLHWFVEKTLLDHTDGMIDTTQNSQQDSLLNELNDRISRAQGQLNGTATIQLVHNLQETRCFVKKVNNSSMAVMAVIIIPSVEAILNAVSKTPRPVNENEARHLSILLFSCKRLTPLDGGVPSGLPSQLKDLILEPTSLHGSARTALSPTILSGGFLDDKDIVRMSDQTRIMSCIANVYAHGFVKSIYGSILQRRQVAAADFHKAIETCVETSLDIDISAFVNVHIRAALNDNDSNLHDVRKRFSDIFGQYFELVASGDDEFQNIYYYRPPSKGGKTGMNLADVFTLAERPLFIKLECTFKKPPPPPTLAIIQETQQEVQTDETNAFSIAEMYNEYQATYVRFPVSDLPTSYECTVHKKYYDFSPDAIGTSNSPVESADGTSATLHMTCLTLPSIDEHKKLSLGFVEYEPNDFSSPLHVSHSAETYPKEIQEALEKTRSNIDRLLRDEILHKLLKLQPYDRTTLTYIQEQLEANKQGEVIDKIKTDQKKSVDQKKVVDQDQNESFSTTYKIPLRFVHQDRGQQRFLQELIKFNMKPFILNKVEEYYYISKCDQMEKGVKCSLGRSTLDESENIPNVSDNNQNIIESTGHSDGGLGLGIVMSPAEPDSSSRTDTASNAKSQKNQPFWLLLAPETGFVSLYFYSKVISRSERTTIVEEVEKYILKVCKRVNQLTLLDELIETHICSDYLVPPDEIKSVSDDGTEKSDEQEFKYGQFECPRVYETTFPLHWRLRPNQALAGITSSLNWFAVANRKHMYVVPDKDHIVYIKLSEISNPSLVVDPENAAELDRQTSALPQVNGTDANEQSTQQPSAEETEDLPPNKVQSPQTSNLGAERSVAESPNPWRVQPKSGLLVEVYGLNLPGEKITVDLTSSLENKLNTNVTLPVISTHLARNYKLSYEDVEFILPIKKGPSRSSLFYIPKFVKNTASLLFYFQQNLLRYLNTLNGMEAALAVKRYHHDKIKAKLPADSEKKLPQLTEPYLGDMAFYYNSSMRPSSFETSIGQGISGMILTLLDQESQPVFKLPPQDRSDPDDTDMSTIIEYVQAQQSTPQSTPRFTPWLSSRDISGRLTTAAKNCDYRILVEMWSQGPINSDTLMERIFRSFRQSLCDYFVELSVSKSLRYSAADNLEAAALAIPENNEVDDRPNSRLPFPLIDSHLQRVFVEPVFEILKKSAEWQNPAVNVLDTAFETPSCISEELLKEINTFMTDIHTALSPTIWSQVSAETCQVDDHQTDESDHKRKVHVKLETLPTKPTKYILVSGLKELGAPKQHKPTSRRNSVGNERSQPRRNSVFQHRQTTEELMMNRPTQNTFDGQSQQNQEYHQSCFVIMAVGGFSLTLYTYNLNKIYKDQIFKSLNKLMDWHNQRTRLLNSILYQKMGLFYHKNTLPPVKSTQTSVLTASTVPNTPRPSGPPNASAPRPTTVYGNSLDTTNVSLLICDKFPSRVRDEERKSFALPVDMRAELTKLVTNDLDSAANVSIISVLDVNETLKNAFTETPVEHSVKSSETGTDKFRRPHNQNNRKQRKLSETNRDEEDLLQKYGRPFLDSCVRKARISQTYAIASKISENWAQTHELLDDVNVKPTISNSTFTCLLRVGSAVHLLEQQGSSKETTALQFNTTIESLLKDYATYLESIGMTMVIFGDAESNLIHNDDGGDKLPSFTSKIVIDGDLSITAPAVFTAKICSAGIILCEVRMEGALASLSLYSLTRSAIDGGDKSNGLTELREECHKIKHLLHFKSFIYDFHLRYLTNVLRTPEAAPSIDVLELLKHFIISHPEPRKHARHRIYHGTFVKELENIEENSLFTYIIMNPQRYGFRSIYHGDETIGCFTTAFCANQEDPERCKCLLILRSSSKQFSDNGRFLLDYDIISFYDCEGHEQLPLSNDEPLMSVHGRRNVLNQGKQKIDSTIERAIECYARDKLWEQLESTKNQANINPAEFINLTQCWCSRLLSSLQPEFREFLDLPLDWTEIFNFLATYYSDKVREVNHDGSRHLVIFNPFLSGHLIHFVLDPNNIVRASAVCREETPEYEPQFTAEIMRTIGYLIWKRIVL
ncbi:2550_t:CDS:10 [Paraglomus occultum]|uniref:2550_t:CDS:1 n=1 Tax=Paraglomus occultum TaxID=144539 RepID=A0A9N9A834_9GLOM|nr:2550_t:CDS:10 [Paraglomus occultum]